MLTYRMLGPVPTGSATSTTTTTYSRSYTGSPGQVFDIPDGDAQILGAAGWVLVCPSGPTSARPTTSSLDAPGGYVAAKGVKFFDTTLSQSIVFDGATWRDPATGESV
jgi:hypothetical protein